MAVKRTGLGKGLDSMIPPKATQRAVKEDKNTVSKTGETILKINEVEPLSLIHISEPTRH